MQLTPLIQKAINAAAMLHASIGQLRKDPDKLPYIVHPFSVAWILAHHGADEEVIAAGLLHDVVEDVIGHPQAPAAYTRESLRQDFGERVYQLVLDVSEEKSPAAEPATKKPTWLIRKEKYLAHLAESSDGAVMIAVADKIHNLRSMLGAIQRYGAENILSLFNAQNGKMLWYHEAVYELALTRLKNPIVQELAITIEEARGVMK